MDIVTEILLGLLYLVFTFGAIAGLWYGAYKAFPLLLDGEFGPEGVDIVIFGCIPVFRIKRANIREAIIAKRVGWFRQRLANHDYESMTAVSLVNRWSNTGVVIRTTGLLWWYFSPRDPESAVAALRCPHRRA